MIANTVLTIARKKAKRLILRKRCKKKPHVDSKNFAHHIEIEAKRINDLLI